MPDYKYHYQNAHSVGDESRRNDIADMSSILRMHNLLPSDKKARILELGCGFGRLLLALKDAGYENLTGIEMDKSQFDVAKSEKLNVILDDALHFLAKSKEKYDVIFAIDFIEHIPKDKIIECLEMMQEHLTGTGFIALQTPNAFCPTFGFFRYADFTHNLSFTQESLGYCLRNAGMHYFTMRPHMIESKRVQDLKFPFAEMYREEYGLKDFILTAHLFCVAFKNEAAFYEWSADAPEIKNDYAKPLGGRFLQRLKKVLSPEKKTAGKYWLVSFGDSRMKRAAKRIIAQTAATGIFKEIFVLNERDLSPKFRSDFPQMKKDSRGYGYWCWKPRVILDTLEKMRYGETLLFVDIGCHINPARTKEFVALFDKCAKSKSGILGFQSALKVISTKYWCKGDVLDYFGVRKNREILETSDIAGGLIFIQKRENTIKLVQDWMRVYYDDFHLADDSPSKSPNLSTFRENRHDQTIFTILMKLRGGETIVGEHDKMFCDDINANPREAD